jgi:arylsulfatase A-like enzyme
VTRVSRRHFLQASTAAASASLLGAASPGPSRPNILFLLGDDHRWDVLGAAGNAIVQTPHLDALAHRGTRFTHAFVTTSICMASRATILTGQHTTTHGIDNFSKSFTDDQLQQTYPLRLRDAGYHTGFIGKWGVGNDLPVDDFDYFDGFPGQGKYLHEIEGETRHLTEMQGESAVNFIEEAPRDRPFCLSVSFKAPHVQDEDPRQFVYDPKLESLYQDVTIPTPETVDARYFDAMPEFIQTSECRTRWHKRFSNPEHLQQSVKGYYRLVTGIDDATGQMIAALNRAGRLDNTIVVYVGDNGMFLGEHGLAGKWLMHEESIRVPFIAAGPGIAAQVRDEMVLSNDVAPTLLDMAGLPPSPTMDGRSLVPLLRGETRPWRTEWFYEHDFTAGGRIPVTEGIRTRDWKYICYPAVEPVYEELYHVAQDPLETANLAQDPAHADVRDRLRARWAVWKAHLADPPRPWREPAAPPN